MDASTTRRQRKAGIKTTLVVKQRKDMHVVTDLEKCCMKMYSTEPLHSQAVISTSGNRRPFGFSGV